MDRPDIRFAGRRLPLPRSKAARVTLGAALVIGGTFGFLPILGLWMLPLGLLVLSADSPKVRRARRRLEIRFGRRVRPAGRRFLARLGFSDALKERVSTSS